MIWGFSYHKASAHLKYGDCKGDYSQSSSKGSKLLSNCRVIARVTIQQYHHMKGGWGGEITS